MISFTPTLPETFTYQSYAFIVRSETVPIDFVMVSTDVDHTFDGRGRNRVRISWQGSDQRTRIVVKLINGVEEVHLGNV